MIEQKNRTVFIGVTIGKPEAGVVEIRTRRRKSEIRTLPSIKKPLEIKVNLDAQIPQPMTHRTFDSRNGSQNCELAKAFEKSWISNMPIFMNKRDTRGRRSGIS